MEAHLDASTKISVFPRGSDGSRLWRICRAGRRKCEPSCRKLRFLHFVARYGGGVEVGDGKRRL